MFLYFTLFISFTAILLDPTFPCNNVQAIDSALQVMEPQIRTKICQLKCNDFSGENFDRRAGHGFPGPPFPPQENIWESRESKKNCPVVPINSTHGNEVPVGMSPRKWFDHCPGQQENNFPPPCSKISPVIHPSPRFFLLNNGTKCSPPMPKATSVPPPPYEAPPPPLDPASLFSPPLIGKSHRFKLGADCPPPGDEL